MSSVDTLAYNPLPYDLDSTHGQYMTLLAYMDAQASYSRTMIAKMAWLIRLGPREGWSKAQMLLPVPGSGS